MALPISLYDPMVLIEAAATLLTACYILKLAFQETLQLNSSHQTSAQRMNHRPVRNYIPSSRIIEPIAAPQSSLPVLAPLPMNRTPINKARSITFTPTVAKPVDAQPRVEPKRLEQKIVPINANKRVTKVTPATISNGRATVKLQQTDWLQRA